MNPIVQTLSNLDVNSRGGCFNLKVFCLHFQHFKNKDHEKVFENWVHDVIGRAKGCNHKRRLDIRQPDIRQ